MSTKKLIWDEKYSVGVEEIDNQHKRFFGIINEALDAIYSEKPEEFIDSIIKQLFDYRDYHFSTEEKYFKEFNYVDSVEHIKQHTDFGEDVVKLQNKYPQYSFEFAFELLEFMENWLINHILQVDKGYTQCFVEHGLK